MKDTRREAFILFAFSIGIFWICFLLGGCASPPQHDNQACHWKWELAVEEGSRRCYERTVKRCTGRDWERFEEQMQCEDQLQRYCREIAQEVYETEVYGPCREGK